MHHLKFVHLLCQEHVKEGSSLIDATMGNGHDTLFLAKLIEKHEKSTLTAYDIQEMALQSTRARLNTHNLLNRVQLKMSCHTHIEDDFEQLQGPCNWGHRTAVFAQTDYPADSYRRKRLMTESLRFIFSAGQASSKSRSP